MVEIGKRNSMEVMGRVDFGVYLNGGDDGDILLPIRDTPDDCEVGQTLDVFIYLDSKDRLIATTATPLIEVGECACLEVIQSTSLGAFLDWGLQKDLFLPFAEQRWPVKEGYSCVVIAYVDNTRRIAASTKLGKHLTDRSDIYKEGDEVSLLLSNHSNLGWEAVVDGVCLGLLFQSDTLGRLTMGDKYTGYIKNVRPDGKLDLSLQRPGKAGRVELATQILEHIKAQGGSSALTDKSTPEAIFKQFGVSKKAYKKALGGLYKTRKIVIEEGTVRLASPPKRRR